MGNATIEAGMYVYEDKFRDDLGPDEVEKLLEHYADGLRRMEIDGRVDLGPQGTLRLSFTNEADFHFFRDEQARVEPEYETARHVQHFDGCTPQHERTWVSVAAMTLREAGMDFQSEHNEGRYAVFTFPTYMGQVMFSKLVETGFIDRRAAMSIKHKISPTGGAWDPSQPVIQP